MCVCQKWNIIVLLRSSLCKRSVQSVVFSLVSCCYIEIQTFKWWFYLLRIVRLQSSNCSFSHLELFLYLSIYSIYLSLFGSLFRIRFDMAACAYLVYASLCPLIDIAVDFFRDANLPNENQYQSNCSLYKYAWYRFSIQTNLDFMFIFIFLNNKIQYVDW